MRSLVVAFVICASLIGCGSSPPARPTTPKTTIAAINSVPPPTESVPHNRRIARDDRSCALFFEPREVGSVVRVPAKMMSLAMDPVMHALCSCTNSGEYAVIAAQIDFGQGTVSLRAPESTAIHECLETLKLSFAPPDPSDVPASDCINCGPRHYGVFVDSAPPPKPGGLRLMYSFLLDRSNEVLDCPKDTHAERGECRSNAPPEPAKPEKKSCGCAATDLDCAMQCAARQ